VVISRDGLASLLSFSEPGIELLSSKYQFTHANGAIEPTRVKKL